jgi:hypothetical protein
VVVKHLSESLAGRYIAATSPGMGWIQYHEELQRTVAGEASSTKAMDLRIALKGVNGSLSLLTRTLILVG